MASGSDREPFALSAVCRVWRDLFINDRTLWSSLSLCGPNDLETRLLRTRLVLERCKGRLLALHISMQGEEDEDGDYEEWPEDMDVGPLAPIIGRLAGSLGSLIRLTVIAKDGSEDWSLWHGRLTSLAEVNLYLDESTHTCDLISLLVPVGHSLLRTANIFRLSASPTHTDFSVFSHLHSLNFKTVSIPDPSRRALLESLQNLQTWISMDGDEVEPDVERGLLVFTRLENLQYDMKASAASLPSLVKLVVGPNSSDDHRSILFPDPAPFADLPRHLQPPFTTRLTSLFLYHDDPFDEFTFVADLPQLLALEHLFIFPTVTDFLIRSLIVHDPLSALLPRLRILALRSSGLLSCAPVVAMVKSRSSDRVKASAISRCAKALLLVSPIPLI